MPSDVQPGDYRQPDLAPPERQQPVAQGRQWCDVQGRYRGDRRSRDYQRDCRLITPSAKLGHSSYSGGLTGN